MTTCDSYRCQKEEQCDDCFLTDHLKECAGCEHYDHENKESWDEIRKGLTIYLTGIPFTTRQRATIEIALTKLESLFIEANKKQNG